MEAAVQAHDDLWSARNDDADLALLPFGYVLGKDVDPVVVGIGADAGVGVRPSQALCDDGVHSLQHEIHLAVRLAQSLSRLGQFLLLADHFVFRLLHLQLLLLVHLGQQVVHSVLQVHCDLFLSQCA